MADGRGKGSGEGGDRGQGEFGDLDEISRFAPVHAICQRPQEIMTKWAHRDMHIEPQDEGVLLDDVDLGTGEDQPHNATTGSQNHNTFESDFRIDRTYSPARLCHWVNQVWRSMGDY